MTGPTLTLAMDRAGLTSRQLATLLHVGLKTVHSWRQGRRSPGSVVLRRKLESVLKRRINPQG